MVTAVKQTVTIQPGGLVEVRSSELKAGDRVEVIVLVEPQAAGQNPLAAFRGAAKGLYSSIEEVDAFIRNERDAWDR